MFHQNVGDTFYNVHYKWRYTNNGIETDIETSFTFTIIDYNAVTLYHRQPNYRKYYNPKAWSVLYKEMYHRHYNTLNPVFGFF